MRSERLALEYKLESKRASKLREEEFRKKVNPSYTYESDLLRTEEVATIARLESELAIVESKLVDVEGNVTFRVGFPEWSEVDDCFSPALQPVRSLEVIFEMITGKDHAGLEDMAELFVDLMKALPKAEARDFIAPVIKLAQKRAADNKAKSFKFLTNLRRTPFDSFCRRLDRTLIRVAKKLGLPVVDNIVPNLEEMTNAFQNAKSFTYATETVNLDKERKDCGDSWDESIMPTIQWMIEAEIISVSSTQARTSVDLDELQDLYDKMNVRMAHKSDYFAKSDNEEYVKWSNDFDLFRKKREELRVTINALKVDRSKKIASPIKRK